MGAAISSIDQGTMGHQRQALRGPGLRPAGRQSPRQGSRYVSAERLGRALVESAACAVRDGFTAVKMTPFPIGWPEKRYPNLIRECTGIVAAIRETVGWNVDIGVEIHRNMVPSEAVIFAQQIKNFLPYFYEDPIAPDSGMSTRDVAQKVNLPIAAGERNHTIWEFREFSEINGVAFFRPDVSLAGGISQVKKIAAIAESYNQRVKPHNFLCPVGTVVGV